MDEEMPEINDHLTKLSKITKLQHIANKKGIIVTSIIYCL